MSLFNTPKMTMMTILTIAITGLLVTAMGVMGPPTLNLVGILIGAFTFTLMSLIVGFILSMVVRRLAPQLLIMLSVVLAMLLPSLLNFGAFSNINTYLSALNASLIAVGVMALMMLPKK